MGGEPLKAICLEARRLRDETELLEDQFYCKEVSLAICYKASEAGIRTSLCIGTFKDLDGHPRDHYWVRHEKTIYDATADQFDPKLAEIHIVSELDAVQYDEHNFVIFNPEIARIIKKMK
ncbi:TPA: hypothetical protein ACGQSM_003728 [Serratia liquefaciens]|uniref:hypothetical protein n=1 Tax=Serratia sp. BIGb0234 TaxID=2940614 RepID=UPI00216A75A6|nr:hypothetical protein [Serratia sp. BIGb0234]MCS4317090.1 hypothetical protein [Serratia sp. BIGb0234]HEJ7948959.1 hypothetical protein [Serratia liquefaciens]HEJ7993986.1 hypothetical protein [Serratia liquefaciens]